MRIRLLCVMTSFAAAIVLMAAHVQPVRAHAGDDNPGHVHACVGSFGGVRIVGVNGTCAATETALHWNPSGLPTTLSAAQTSLLLVTPDSPQSDIPGASITFTLNSPATVDIRADGAVQLQGGVNVGCSVLSHVDGSAEVLRSIQDIGDNKVVNWSGQRNGVSLAAGSHTISLELAASGASAAQCRQNNSNGARARLWILVR